MFLKESLESLTHRERARFVLENLFLLLFLFFSSETLAFGIFAHLFKYLSSKTSNPSVLAVIERDPSQGATGTHAGQLNQGVRGYIWTGRILTQKSLEQAAGNRQNRVSKIQHAVQYVTYENRVMLTGP